MPDAASDPMRRRPNTVDDLVERVGSAEALDRLDTAPLPDEPFDWLAVDDQDIDFVRRVLDVADECCSTLLDVEFRTIARRILARVAANDPRPLRRSPNHRRFAGGLVWLAGRANGEFTRHSRWDARTLWEHLDVTSSCADRGWTIRTAAGLVPEARTWEPFWDRDATIKVGDSALLHSRTRAHLIQRRDAARALAARTANWRVLADGTTVAVRARPAPPLLAAKGHVEGSGRAQVLVGFGDDVERAAFFALTIPEAHDLVHRLEVALAAPMSWPERW